MLLVGDKVSTSTNALYIDGGLSLFSIVKPKALVVHYSYKLDVPSLLSFFITCGKSQLLYSSASTVLTGLVLGLFGHSSEDSALNSVSSLVPFGEVDMGEHLVSNTIRCSLTDLGILDKKFSQLPLGVIIKYTKLSRQVRKNLRGKQRYKAYLTLPQEAKIRGCVFRLYKLYALASSDTRNYESCANLNFLVSELYFNDLNYDMVYLQIQKLMLQSYVDNGSRAVVPNVANV